MVGDVCIMNMKLKKQKSSKHLQNVEHCLCLQRNQINPSEIKQNNNNILLLFLLRW